VAMTGLALSDNRTVQDVECGKQGGGAVPIVIVGYPIDVSQPHRQHRLAALQRLNLAFLVHAQHQCLVGGVEVESDHVPDLFDEKRVGREFEALAAVRLQPKEGEIAPHRAFGDAAVSRRGAHAPVGIGSAMEHPLYQLGDPLIVVAARPPRPQFPVQSGDAILAPATPPVADGRLTPQRSAMT